MSLVDFTQEGILPKIQLMDIETLNGLKSDNCRGKLLLRITNNS